MSRLEEIKESLKKWNIYSGTQAVNFLGDRREDMDYLIRRVEHVEAIAEIVKSQCNAVLKLGGKDIDAQWVIKRMRDITDE